MTKRLNWTELKRREHLNTVGGIETGTATMRNSMEVSLKTENGTWFLFFYLQVNWAVDLTLTYSHSEGLPSCLSGRESACQCRRYGFDPWVRKIPWSRKQQLTSVFLPGESHGQRNLAGYIQSMGSQRVGYDWATKHASDSWGFPGGSVVKNLTANAGDMGSIPGSGRSPGEGNGNPLQFSCLGNPMDIAAWQATVREVAKSWTWFSH